jgi:hypothetical protein
MTLCHSVMFFYGTGCSTGTDHFIRAEVLTGVIHIFWDVTPYSVVDVYRRMLLRNVCKHQPDYMASHPTRQHSADRPYSVRIIWEVLVVELFAAGSCAPSQSIQPRTVPQICYGRFFLNPYLCIIHDNVQFLFTTKMHIF